jgi:hypothetical protein
MTTWHAASLVLQSITLAASAQTCRFTHDVTCQKSDCTTQSRPSAGPLLHLPYAFAAFHGVQLSALSTALPGVDLSHILPCAVVSGDMQHVCSLLQLLEELSHMPEGRHTAQQGHKRIIRQCHILGRNLTHISRARSQKGWARLLQVKPCSSCMPENGRERRPC